MNIQGVAGYTAAGVSISTGLGGASRSGSLLTPSRDAGQDHKVDATFAAEMVRRIAANYVRPKSGDDTGDGSGKAYDPAALADSMTRTVDFVRDRFGAQAATAFMGVVAAGVGQGAVTEESMGKAMLSGIRMIDSNYGIAAGDELMANLNGDLNNAVNAYFDNGQNEVIYAVTLDASGASGATGGSAGSAVYSRLGEAARSVMAKFGQGDAGTLMDLIKSSLVDGKGQYDLLRGNLVEAVEQLRAKHAAEADGVITQLEAALAGDAPSPLPSGTLVSMTV
jgi:hypothetical protein